MQEKVVIKKGKKQTVHERFLPGYILVKMIPSNEAIHLIKTTEGIRGFVSNFAKSKYPTPLDQKQAESILEFTKVKQNPVFDTKLSIGDAVKVVEGPFKDFIGKIQDINETKGQATVLLSIFGRETPVQFDILQISKI
ncbi:MAG: KOW motif-containing protein, partial [Candidatus Dojkabacteria bacterium]|nr:KOW motif-containing protein [Candidatus Dojkabacteria bacterium]